MASDHAKRAAALKAVELVSPNMVLGIGTGSTARYFIEALGDKVRDGLNVQGIPTSLESEKLARENAIDLITPDETTRINLAIDGADEIDGRLNLIKGGGGALFREKIIAQSTDHFIVIGDTSKKVTTLGAFDLPLEIEPFGWALTVQAVRNRLVELGWATPKVSLRPGHAGMFTSDGGNYILDCKLGRIDDPVALDSALRTLPGVIETGLFIGLTDLVIIGNDDGTTTSHKAD